MTPPFRLILNRTQAQDLLGLSVEAMRAAIKARAPGVLDAGGRGRGARIDFAEFYQWWLEKKRAERERAERPPVCTAAARETEIDIRLKELRFQRQAEALLPRDDAQRLLEGALQQIGEVLQDMPAREAPRVVGLSSMLDAVEHLTAIADRMRDDLRNPARWLGLGAGTDVPPTTTRE